MKITLKRKLIYVIAFAVSSIATQYAYANESAKGNLYDTLAQCRQYPEFKVVNWFNVLTDHRNDIDNLDKYFPPLEYSNDFLLKLFIVTGLKTPNGVTNEVKRDLIKFLVSYYTLPPEPIDQYLTGSLKGHYLDKVKKAIEKQLFFNKEVAGLVSTKHNPSTDLKEYCNDFETNFSKLDVEKKRDIIFELNRIINGSVVSEKYDEKYEKTGNLKIISSVSKNEHYELFNLVVTLVDQFNNDINYEKHTKIKQESEKREKQIKREKQKINSYNISLAHGIGGRIINFLLWLGLAVFTLIIIYSITKPKKK